MCTCCIWLLVFNVPNHRPGIFRATNVLVHYRGFQLPEGPQFRSYVERLLSFPAFKRTCSTEQLYIDSYERLVQTYSHVHASLIVCKGMRSIAPTQVK